MYRLADVCAGIGGIRMGFNQACPSTCVFTSELDPHCRQVYLDNFRDTHPYNTDITKIAPSDIPDFDVLLAGFPCQSFSTAGQKLGFEDIRGTLFFYLAEIIRAKRPAIFLLENVDGLVYHEKGRTFSVIKRILKRDLGYCIYYQVLNARDYGSAQNRRRIYIVGFREPRKFRFPAPTNSSLNILVSYN